MTEVKRPVFFSGENPVMTLYIPGTEQAVAVVSYWLCTDSPHGIGHALVLWLAEETSQHGGIFTDNPRLAKVLVKTLTQHFPEFQHVPIGELEYIDAECKHIYDGERYLVTCQSVEMNVEIEWGNLLERKQILWPEFPAGDQTFDLTTVIAPCGVGHIRVNGQEIAGEVQVESKDGKFSSSAFLAFSETWVGPLA